MVEVSASVNLEVSEDVSMMSHWIKYRKNMSEEFTDSLKNDESVKLTDISRNGESEEFTDSLKNK